MKPLNTNLTPKDNAEAFKDRYYYINTLALDDILEDLQDLGYLSKKGEKFREAFWKRFIKKK